MCKRIAVLAGVYSNSMILIITLFVGHHFKCTVMLF